MIGLASLLSQIFLFAFALKYSFFDDGAFSFSFRAVTAESRVISPMLVRSWPVITEKALFSFGKTIVNSMCTLYGDTMVGAMGVSNNLGGITTNPPERVPGRRCIDHQPEPRGQKIPDFLC